MVCHQTPQHVSGAGVECWVQNRHLRHRHVHVSLNNPEQVQVLHLITCYRNLSIHLIFQKQRDSQQKKNKESVLRSACSWRPNSNLLLGETRTLVTMGNQSICELMQRMNMYKALSLSVSFPPGGLAHPRFCSGSPRFTCVALLSLWQLAK